MAFIDKLSDAGRSLFDQSIISLNRRIDNELNSDFLPSPQTATPQDQSVVKTSDSDPRGVAKVAGSGSSWLPKATGQNMVLGAAAVAIGALIYFAVR